MNEPKKRYIALAKEIWYQKQFVYANSPEEAKRMFENGEGESTCAGDFNYSHAEGYHGIKEEG